MQLAIIWKLQYKALKEEQYVLEVFNKTHIQK